MVSKSFMSDHLATHAARGAAKIAVATYLSNLAAVASGIIIPRFLGKDAYGEYAFLTASFLLAGMSSRLGLRLIITRQFAPLYNSRELDKAAGLYRAYFLTNLASGLIVSAICFFFLEFASPFKISSSAFILVSLLLFTWSLSESLFVLQLGVRHYGYWGLVFLLLLPAKQIRPDFRLLWSHARLAILAFVTQLADNLRRYLGVMLVAFVTLNTDLTGYYELSLRIAVLVSSSLLLTAGSLMPTLSILYEQKDESRLFDWIELATRGGLFILILIWGVFALVGRPLIVFLVGESFEPVYPLVFILLLSLPFRWIETMYDQSCNVNQRPELNIPSRIVWLTSFVALGIWGLDKWNLPGLAAAYCLSFIVSCGVSYLVAWRALRVRIVKMRSLTMLLCASPFVAALFWSVGVYERTIAASISVLLGFLIAQLSSSLRVNEIATLFRIAKGL
jgi:O-antigen/teichoic acid export membrane protein